MALTPKCSFNTAVAGQEERQKIHGLQPEYLFVVVFSSLILFRYPFSGVSETF